MRKQVKEKKVSPSIIFRHLTLFGLVLVLVIIGLNIISRSGKEARILLSDEELEERKVQKREEVVYLQDEKGNLVLESKADRQYLGEDGFYHMEGDVLIKFLKRAEGEDVVIRGGEVLRDQKENRLMVQGNAEIRFKDLVIRSSYLEYDNKEHIIKTDEGVSFSSDRVKGEGKSLICWEREKDLKIKNDVHLEFTQDQESSKVIYASGDELYYTHKWGNGYIQGKASVKAGENSVQTDRLEFYLPPAKDFLRSLFLEGNVRGEFVLNSKPEEDRERERYKVGAEEVFVRFFKYLDTPQRIDAKGDCFIDSHQQESGFNRIQSGRFTIDFRRSGEISNFIGSDKVLLEDSAEGHKRQIRGNEFSLDKAEETLTVVGDSFQKAEIFSEDYDISADKISSFLNSQDLSAEGEITGVFRSSGSHEMNIGIFSESQPVFISAQSMRYLEELERFVFKEKVKLWQGQEMLTAGEVVVKKEREGLSASKGVQTLFHYDNKQQEGKKIRVLSQSMEFDPQEHRILYQKECSMEIGDVRIKADSLCIQIEEREMKDITAEGSVVISMGVYEGRGENAVYSFDNEEIVLTGNPVLIEENRGRTEGDKLTFSMANDRIIVENRGDERSVTVIKK